MTLSSMQMDRAALANTSGVRTVTLVLSSSPFVWSGHLERESVWFCVPGLWISW